jgi:hypothetical protein
MGLTKRHPWGVGGGGERFAAPFEAVFWCGTSPGTGSWLVVNAAVVVFLFFHAREQARRLREAGNSGSPPPAATPPPATATPP